MNAELVAACERVVRSRERLRLAMHEAPAPGGSAPELGLRVMAALGALARGELQGQARAHPFRLLFAAFAGGAAITALRPWGVLRQAGLSALLLVPPAAAAMVPLLATGALPRWLLSWLAHAGQARAAQEGNSTATPLSSKKL